MDIERARRQIATNWSGSIVPTLMDYIRIPNKSPAFDPDWAARGDMDQAVDLMTAWARTHGPPGMELEVVRLPGRTPLIFIEVPGAAAGTVLLYGHLDKQPEFSGWRPGLGPWEPVLEGDRLFGRGGADDGYALFASLGALSALADQGIPHGRCVVLIEASEESGSPDLPAYMDALGDRIAEPELVICLDSGAGNYSQLWCTTSLRGLVGGTLTVDTLAEGVHSGDAGGIVPSSFRVLRTLLDRLEDPETGTLLPAKLHVPIPDHRIREAQGAAAQLGAAAWQRFPYAGETEPVSTDPTTVLLNRAWRPSLEIIGAAGLPAPESAGNVLRPGTSVKLSIRIPPRVDATRARAAIKDLLEDAPPYHAQVRFEPDWAADGWEAPAFAPWLSDALETASQTWFGRPAVHTGEGWSIPFMAMLGERFPTAQFMITGVLGPGSNAHGPNEFLHIPMAQGLTGCVASVIAAHARRGAGASDDSIDSAAP
jgi:acetylornithine deacetylase/succinyl-diaminopimelate desuccinylase-like protein